jgi:hypothetical protein
MDQETQRNAARLHVMEQMFEHEGWSEVVRELENEVEVIKGQLLAAETWEDVKFLQGKSEQCFSMIYMADAVANIKAQLEYDNADV